MKGCFNSLSNSESSRTENQTNVMAYLLLANIFFLIELTIECCWIWIKVPTWWITLRLPIPIPIKLKIGESFVQVPMPPTVHTGFMGSR